MNEQITKSKKQKLQEENEKEADDVVIPVVVTEASVVDNKNNTTVQNPPVVISNCNRENNNYTLKDDTIAIMLSCLNVREMGKASCVCKQWKDVFLQSNIIQTNNDIQTDIRWLKYAARIKPPPKRLVYDAKCDHVICSFSSSLGNQNNDNDDDYWLSIHGNGLADEGLRSDESKIKIHSSAKGKIVSSFIVEGNFSTAFVSNDGNVIITSCHEIYSGDEYYEEDYYDDYDDDDYDYTRMKPYNIQVWRKNSSSGSDSDVSKYQKGPYITGLRYGIKRIVMTNDGKIYCRAASTIQTWNPFIENESSSHLTILTSNVCSYRHTSALIIWKDMLIFDDEDNSIQIWSTKDNQHVTTMIPFLTEEEQNYQQPVPCVLDIVVREVHGKDIIFSGHEDRSVRLFSIDDQQILHTIKATSNSLMTKNVLWSEMAISPTTDHVAFATYGVDISDRVIQI